jgi:hypothetical protein
MKFSDALSSIHAVFLKTVYLDASNEETDSYGIRALDASGSHTIEHYSGGASLTYKGMDRDSKPLTLVMHLRQTEEFLVELEIRGTHNNIDISKVIPYKTSELDSRTVASFIVRSFQRDPVILYFLTKR